MMKMYFRGIHTYYVAYCFETEDEHGFGRMIISNKSKLEIRTSEDIKIIEDYIKDKSKELKNKNIKSIVIMDWRELKNE